MSKDNHLSARVLILLALDNKKDSNLNHKQIASTLNTTVTTIIATARDYFENGLDYAIIHHYNPSSLRPRKINGELEAHFIQLACGEATEGYARWNLELLTEEVNKKGVAEPVSKETIRVMLKKELKPHLNEYWCIPPKENAEFVACMEDILHIYSLPYNKEVPVICMDEKSYQLLGETREPMEARPGDIKKLDSEYVCCGTRSIFVFTEPLANYWHVSVRRQRTKKDWAEEIYYTPKHGSWLNIAEIELNAMTRQCLDRRIDDIQCLSEELSAWESKQ